MDRWAGKVAVVTGASAGIGSIVARELADQGIITVGLARRDEKIKNLATKGTLRALKCDLRKEEDIVKAFEWIEKEFGGVDLLVNNAGVCPFVNLTEEGTTEKWKETLEVNVLSLSICTREALKSMRKRGDNGHIIHVNSICGHQIYDFEGLSMYTASKYGVTALAQCLRNELKASKSQIKVTNFSPGYVHTTISLTEEVENFDIEARPPGALRCQDVADAIVSIISLKSHVQVDEYVIQAIDVADTSVQHKTMMDYKLFMMGNALK